MKTTTIELTAPQVQAALDALVSAMKQASHEAAWAKTTEEAHAAADRYKVQLEVTEALRIARHELEQMTYSYDEDRQRERMIRNQESPGDL